MNPIRRLAILDCETTGIPGRDAWAEAIELAAVIVDTDTGEEVAPPFERLIAPSILDERCDAALAVNGIMRDMLAGQLSAREVRVEFLAWAAAHNVDAFTSYNVAFDRAILDIMGLRFLSWAPCLMLGAMPAMAAAGKLRPRRRVDSTTGIEGQYLWPSLAACVEHFGIDVVGEAHRALTDARTAAEVWRRTRGQA